MHEIIINKKRVSYEIFTSPNGLHYMNISLVPVFFSHCMFKQQAKNIKKIQTLNWTQPALNIINFKNFQSCEQPKSIFREAQITHKVNLCTCWFCALVGDRLGSTSSSSFPEKVKAILLPKRAKTKRNFWPGLSLSSRSKRASWRERTWALVHRKLLAKVYLATLWGLCNLII